MPEDVSEYGQLMCTGHCWVYCLYQEWMNFIRQPLLTCQDACVL